MFHLNWKYGVLLTSTIALSSCIGAPQTHASATRTGMGPQSRRTAAHRGVSNSSPFCEPPELTTGDLTPVDSAPCGTTFMQSQQVTAGPPQIRRY